MKEDVMNSFSSTRDLAYIHVEGYQHVLNRFEQDAVSVDQYEIVYEGVIAAEDACINTPTPLEVYFGFIDYVFLEYGDMAKITLKEIGVANNHDFLCVLKQMITARVLTFSEHDDFTSVEEAPEINEILDEMKTFDGVVSDYDYKYQ